MEVRRKLAVLADAAKYDASCASSGAKRAGKPGGLGHSDGEGICHSYAPDGRSVSLLKILLSAARTIGNPDTALGGGDARLLTDTTVGLVLVTGSDDLYRLELGADLVTPACSPLTVASLTTTATSVVLAPEAITPTVSQPAGTTSAATAAVTANPLGTADLCAAP